MEDRFERSSTRKQGSARNVRSGSTGQKDDLSPRDIERLVAEQLRLGEEEAERLRERNEISRLVKQQLILGEEETRRDTERIMSKRKSSSQQASPFTSFDSFSGLVPGNEDENGHDDKEEEETLLQVNTVWVDDAKVSKCPLCQSSFNLLRRKVRGNFHVRFKLTLHHSIIAEFVAVRLHCRTS